VSRRRALPRLLDPWAVGVIVVFLGLLAVILVASPGPWNRVIGSPPQVRLVPPPPADVLVYVNGTQQPGRCTAVVWLHLLYKEPGVVLIVVPAETQVRLPGAGYLPLRQAVEDAGPAAVTAALGRLTGVRPNGWLYADGVALQTLFGTYLVSGDPSIYPEWLRQASAGWLGRGPPAADLRRQVLFLRGALDTQPRRKLRAAAFANFVLASEHVQTGLKLEAVASIGRAVGRAGFGRVVLTALPAEVDVTGGQERWRLDVAAVGRLRELLAGRELPPELAVSVRRTRVAARAVVVTTVSARGTARRFAAALRAVLRRSAGRDVPVDVCTVGPPAGDRRELTQYLQRERPLAAVVLVGRADAQSLPAEEAGDACLSALLAFEATDQPAVVCEVPGSDAQAGEVNAALRAAARRGGTPVAPAATVVETPGDGAALSATVVREWAAAAGLLVVRACNPQYLAPRLRSTRVAFSLVERRRTVVGVRAPDAATAARTAALLADLGFTVRRLAGDDGGRVFFRALYCMPGLRPAALVLADDLGLPKAAIVGVGDARVPLTLAQP
jgi:hypothetical protein